MSLLFTVDTNIASHFMRFPKGQVAQRMGDYAVENIGISIVAVGELRFGVARVQSERLHNQVEWLLRRMTVLPLAARWMLSSRISEPIWHVVAP